MKAILLFALLNICIHFANTQDNCPKSVAIDYYGTSITFPDGNCSSVFHTDDPKIEIEFTGDKPDGPMVVFDGKSCFADKYSVSVKKGSSLTSSGKYISFFSSFVGSLKKPAALKVDAASVYEPSQGFESRKCGKHFFGSSGKDEAGPGDICVWSIDTQTNQPVTLTINTYTNAADYNGYWIFEGNDCSYEYLIGQVSQVSGNISRTFTYNSRNLVILYLRSRDSDKLTFEYKTNDEHGACPESVNVDSGETVVTFPQGNCSSLFQTSSRQIKVKFPEEKNMGSMVVFDGQNCIADKYSICDAGISTLTSTGKFISFFSAFLNHSGMPYALTVESVAVSQPTGEFKTRKCGKTYYGSSGRGEAGPEDICVWNIDTKITQNITLTVNSSTSTADENGYWVFNGDDCSYKNLIGQVSQVSGNLSRTFFSDSGKLVILYLRSNKNDTLYFEYKTTNAQDACPGSVEVDNNGTVITFPPGNCSSLLWTYDNQIEMSFEEKPLGPVVVFDGESCLADEYTLYVRKPSMLTSSGKFVFVFTSILNSSKKPDSLRVEAASVLEPPRGFQLRECGNRFTGNFGKGKAASGEICVWNIDTLQNQSVKLTVNTSSESAAENGYWVFKGNECSYMNIIGQVSQVSGTESRTFNSDSGKLVILYLRSSINDTLDFEYETPEVNDTCQGPAMLYPGTTITTFLQGNCSTSFQTHDDSIEITFAGNKPQGPMIVFNGQSCLADEYSLSVEKGSSLTSSGKYISFFSSFFKSSGKPDTLEVKAVPVSEPPRGFEKLKCGRHFTASSGKGHAVSGNLCVWSINTHKSQPVKLTVNSSTTSADDNGYWVFNGNDCSYKNLIGQVSQISGSFSRTFISDSGKLGIIYLRSNDKDTLSFEYETNFSTTNLPEQ